MITQARAAVGAYQVGQQIRVQRRRHRPLAFAD